MANFSKYIALKSSEGLFLNGHSLKLEATPFAFRVTRSDTGHYHLQRLTTKSPIDEAVSTDEITYFKQDPTWHIDQVFGEINQFAIRNVETGEYLSNTGLAGNLPYSWQIIDMTSIVKESQQPINVYVANTFNVVPQASGAVTPKEVQRKSEERAKIEHRIYQLINVAGKNGLSKWLSAKLNTGVFIRSLSNNTSDSLVLFYSPDMSEEAKTLLPAGQQASDFSQIIVKYYSNNVDPVTNKSKETVNYTTLLVEKAPGRGDVELLTAFLNGYQKATELSYHKKLTNGLSPKSAEEVAENMDSVEYVLNMKSICDLNPDDNKLMLQTHAGENIKNFLVDTFISQVPQAAISAMWFFGINKAFVIDASFNNYSSKPCAVSIQYYDNVDKGVLEVDPSIPQGIKGVTKEGENVLIPGIPVPVETTDESTGYANYLVTNKNHFLEGCGILLTFDFEDTDEKLFVSIDVPIFKASKINAEFGKQEGSYKSIFERLSDKGSLEATATSEGLSLSCDVTLNTDHHAKDDTYISIINLKDITA